MYRTRKLYLVLFGVLTAICFIFGLAACNNEDSPPVKLSAPIVSLNEETGVITWNAVPNSDGYEVYEGTTLVSEQTETSYAIVKTQSGTYRYTVKATSTDGGYTTSDASNEVTYTYTEPNSDEPVSPTQLAAPEITLSGNVISWEAVENASYYEVYEGATVVAMVTATNYSVTKTAAGEYSYSVKAASGNSNYLASERSNVVTYTVADSSAATKLAAPEITLSGSVISWDAVEHATGYIVKENGMAVASVTETSYTVTQTIVGTYSYTVFATSTNPSYTTSDSSNTVQVTVTAGQLRAPHIELEGNIITWEAVEHAASYDVYESGRKVYNVVPEQRGELDDEDPPLTYAVSPVAYGTYTYTVVAVSGDSQNISSEHSNGVEYEYLDDKPVLDSPVITLDEETGVITWAAVANADYYEIYENGKRSGIYTSELSYTITRKNPAVYTYAVRAANGNGGYKSSAPSNSVSYTVVATQVTFTVSMIVPADYSTETFTIGLYKGDEKVESKELSSGDDKATFTALADEYVAKLETSVASGYVATQVQLTAESSTGVIKIIQVGNNTLSLGTNRFSVNDQSQQYAFQTFVFIAEKGGYYTIRTDETRGMTVLINDVTYISVSDGLTVATFVLSDGDIAEFSVSGDVVGSNYTFIIEEGEAKQNLVIGTAQNIQTDPANYIINGMSDSVRYLTIEEDTTFTFLFTTATIGTRVVTITINGYEYEFDGDENRQKLIHIEAGTDIEINISVSGDADFDGRNIAFFVWEY